MRVHPPYHTVRVQYSPFMCNLGCSFGWHAFLPPPSIASPIPLYEYEYSSFRPVLVLQYYYTACEPEPSQAWLATHPPILHAVTHTHTPLSIPFEPKAIETKDKDQWHRVRLKNNPKLTHFCNSVNIRGCISSVH